MLGVEAITIGGLLRAFTMAEESVAGGVEGLETLLKIDAWRGSDMGAVEVIVVGGDGGGGGGGGGSGK